MEVVITQTAQDDMRSIRLYLRDRMGKQAAQTFLDTIMVRTGKILSAGVRFSPYTDTPIPEIYRYVPHRNYQIFYRVGNKTVYIMHVLHSRRDIDSLFSGIPR